MRIFRLFLFFIPFIMSVVFGDRPVREVVRANRMFTIVFILLLAVSLTLLATTRTLNGLRHYTSSLEKQLLEVEAGRLSSERHIDTLRQELTACIPQDYNAGRILDRLRHP